jgi:hypothetical protein
VNGCEVTEVGSLSTPTQTSLHCSPYKPKSKKTGIRHHVQKCTNWFQQFVAYRYVWGGNRIIQGDSKVTVYFEKFSEQREGYTVVQRLATLQTPDSRTPDSYSRLLFSSDASNGGLVPQHRRRLLPSSNSTSRIIFHLTVITKTVERMSLKQETFQTTCVCVCVWMAIKKFTAQACSKNSPNWIADI